jgi:hypothetical protein
MYLFAIVYTMCLFLCLIGSVNSFSKKKISVAVTYAICAFIPIMNICIAVLILLENDIEDLLP